MEGSKLLINEPPLQALPTLARLLDVNKAIILQQVQYWVGISGHEKEGHRWIYNSYEEWNKQFSWLKPRAIQYHILQLERDGYIISANFNKDSRDHTKWYRINYDLLENLLKTNSDDTKNSQPTYHELTMDGTKNSQALPETTTETTTIDTLYGEFENVKLSDNELEKLQERFRPMRAHELIEQLSAGIKSKGYKYKSHYAAILNWARRDDAKGGSNGKNRGHTQEDRSARRAASIGAPITGRRG